MVLARLPIGQPIAFAADVQTALDQAVRKAPRPLVDVGPEQPAVAKDDALAIGNRRGDGLVNLGQVEVQNLLPECT